MTTVNNVDQLTRLMACFSMYRDQRADVSALQQGSPLPQPAEPIHQLYLCGRELGADVAARRAHGPHLPAVHPGGESRTVPDVYPKLSSQQIICHNELNDDSLHFGVSESLSNKDTYNYQTINFSKPCLNFTMSQLKQNDYCQIFYLEVQ